MGKIVLVVCNLLKFKAQIIDVSLTYKMKWTNKLF